MLHGALWCGGGILVTGITYLAASGGGTYFLAWGAIVFGAIQFFHGYSGRNRRPSVNESGYEALEYATRLETEGRIQEAMTCYQKIAENCINTPAGRDARKSLDSLRAKVG